MPTAADTETLFRMNVSRGDLAAHIAVFLLCFVSSALGVWTTQSLGVASTLIWPSVGIALAAVILRGYDMWFPIFLAQLLTRSLFTLSTPEMALVAAAAYAFQPLVIVYCMRLFGFEHMQLGTLRTILIFALVALFATALAPLIASVNLLVVHALPSNGFLFTLSRSWGAGIFSTLVITPLALTWYPWRKEDSVPLPVLEVAAALALLFAINCFIFWTPYPSYFGISIVFFVPAVLIWFALRFHPKWLTLGLLITSLTAISGTVLSGAIPRAVMADQLFSVEVYIAMVAAIFLVFGAVVEERRVTARRLEENNERLQKALENASSEDRAKTEFIAILAHELRNPLAPVLSSLELLRMKAEEAGQAEMIELIEIAADHNRLIARLLDDLLDISRITRKRFKLQKQPVELHAIISSAMQTVDAVYRSKKHALLISLPQHDVWFEADPMRLRQIIVNLLFNAAKYTNPSGHITLTATEDSSDLCIKIADNGIGIEQHMLQKIFEPFVQVAKSGLQVGTGLGIGLALTKRLVELHGGRIWARSAGPNKGSEFIVSMPIQRVQLPMQSPKADQVQKASDAPSGQEILVVDDNEAAARGLALLLRHKGHTVSVAHDGRSALDHMRQSASRVVLLDIGLPDMDGYAVSRGIREMYGEKEPLIVAITGYGQLDDKLKARQAGFDYHLTKPVGIGDIEQILRQEPLADRTTKLRD